MMEERRPREREDSLDLTRNTSHDSRPPLYQSPRPSNGSGRESVTSYMNPLPPQTPPTILSEELRVSRVEVFMVFPFGAGADG